MQRSSVAASTGPRPAIRRIAIRVGPGSGRKPREMGPVLYFASMFSTSARPADRRVTGLLLGAVLLWVIAAARIISTCGVFSQTFDEPAQIAAGME